MDSVLNPDAAKEAARIHLDARPDVTAIFGCNDRVAIAAIQAAHKQGRNVPDDLSVIGFDNVALAQHVTPTLTTMRVDNVGMGRLAAQLLVNRIEQPDAALVRAVVRPSLIVRHSVKAMK